MFHKVKSVKPMNNFILSVEFESGEHKHYDVKPLFNKWADFKALANISGLFEQVKVDFGGYGVVWNDYLDLSCDELFEGGKVA